MNELREERRKAHEMRLAMLAIIVKLARAIAEPSRRQPPSPARNTRCTSSRPVTYASQNTVTMLTTASTA